MTQLELILTVGLPRSGKTTWALQRAQDLGTPIVCPDAIRLALHGQRFQPLAESFVWAIAKIMVRALFAAGHRTVIVDATNTTRKRRDDWRDPTWHLSFHELDVPAEECRRRARLLGDGEIIAVIDQMAAKFEPVAADER
jgi:predicted kinase